jgi:hypothetical protein
MPATWPHKFTEVRFKKKNPFHKFTEAMLRLQPYAFQARHFQGIRLSALELPP